MATNPFKQGGGGGGSSNPFRTGSAGQFKEREMQSKLYDAQREGHNLGMKEQALGMSPIEEPGFFSKVGSGALGFLHWATTPIRKTTNALAGGLEEARNFNSVGGTNSGTAAGWSDPGGELQAALRGIKQGWNEDRQYSFGRYIGDASSDVAGRERGQGIAPVRLAQAAFTDANEKAGQTPLEFASRAYGPSSAGTGLGQRLADSTISDILGFAAEAQIGNRLVPARLGRIKVKGDDELVAAGKLASAGKQAATSFDDVIYGQAGEPLKQIAGRGSTKVPQPTPGTLDDLINLPDNFPQANLVDNALVPSSPGKGWTFADDVTRETPTNPFRPSQNPPDLYTGGRSGFDPSLNTYKKGDDALRRVAQVWDPIRGWTTPFQDAQLALGDKLGGLSRAAVGSLPQWSQDALGHLFRNMETDSTPNVQAMNKSLDATKQGSRTGVSNFKDRLYKAVDELAPNITDNERRALYYSQAMGRNLDDPEFINDLVTKLNMPAEEVANLSRLQGLKQFIDDEFRSFRNRGEAQGLFQGIDDPYAPIFTNRTYGDDALKSSTQKMRETLGGLRSVQKQRNLNVDELMDRSGMLATDDILDASERYASTFYNLERKHNLVRQLEDMGIISKQAKNGFEPLSDVIKFGDEGKESTKYFIDRNYKGRLANELNGFLRDTPLGKGMKNLDTVTRPWKQLVTNLNPAYHLRNTIDDFTRTNVMGEGTLDDYVKAVTRETSDLGEVRVQDWVKTGNGQWEYVPGVDEVQTLTSADAKALAKAMGASRTQTQSMGLTSMLDKPAQTSREAYFMTGLRDTGNAKLAKQMVGDDLIDYGDISPFMRDVVRPLAPFATFATKNPAVAANAALRNPGRLAQFDILRDEVAQGDQSVYDQMPEYMRDQGILAWRDGNEVGSFNPGLSQFDWQNFAPGKMGKVAARLPHPIIQALIGLQRGVDANGIPIDTAEGYGQKRVDGLAALLMGKEGADGQQYADAEKKFLYDTILSGPQAMSTMFSKNDREGEGKLSTAESIREFLTRGMYRDYDGNELLLRTLLDDNREREGRLKGFQQTGGEVPSVTDLRKAKGSNPFRSASR